MKENTNQNKVQKEPVSGVRTGSCLQSGSGRMDKDKYTRTIKDAEEFEKRVKNLILTPEEREKIKRRVKDYGSEIKWKNPRDYS